MKIQNVAKTIVRDTAGHVLLLRRSAADNIRAGEWDFPGGGVEAGEDIAVGAVREVMEEVGLDFQPGDLRLIYAATKSSSAGDASVNRFVYTAVMSSDQTVKLSHEHSAYQWFTIDDALREFSHPVYTEALRYARDNNLLN